MTAMSGRVVRVPHQTWHDYDMIADVDNSFVAIADIGWWHVHCTRAGEATAFVVEGTPLDKLLARVRDKLWTGYSPMERTLAVLMDKRKYHRIGIAIGDIALPSELVTMDGVEAWRVDLQELPMIGYSGEVYQTEGRGWLLFPLSIWD